MKRIHRTVKRKKLETLFRDTRQAWTKQDSHFRTFSKNRPIEVNELLKTTIGV